MRPASPRPSRGSAGRDFPPDRPAPGRRPGTADRPRRTSARRERPTARRSKRWTTRTTTRSSASRGPRRRPRSRRPSASSPASIIRTRSPATPRPSGASRRSTRRTPSCPTRRSAALYDRLGADWEAYARAGASGRRGAVPERGARGRAGADPFGGAGSAACPAAATSATSSTRPATPAGSPTSSRRSSAAPRHRSSAGGTGPGRGRRATGGATFEDILAGMGLRRRRRRRPERRGAPAHRAAARPAARRPRPSPRSAWTKRIAGTTRLVDVEGKRLEVTIPPGADTGTRIRLTRQGARRRRPVRRRPPAATTRSSPARGADLERELPLTLREALLGAEVTVRTPKGRVLLTIPAGTQPGRHVPPDRPGHAPLQGRRARRPVREGPDRPADRTCGRGQERRRALPRPRRRTRPPSQREIEN